jgi:hypothetical protein
MKPDGPASMPAALKVVARGLIWRKSSGKTIFRLGLPSCFRKEHAMTAVTRPEELFPDFFRRLVQPMTLPKRAGARSRQLAIE